jgi:hypothetical protein
VGKGRKEWRHFAEVDKRRERDEGSQPDVRLRTPEGDGLRQSRGEGRGKLRVVLA